MLEKYIKINSENFMYVEHCIAQQGGLILQAKLSEGIKTKPVFISNRKIDSDKYSEIIDSWPEAIIDFSIKPKISPEGDSIGNIQHNFDLIYAPSKNIIKIGGLRCVGQGLGENSVYIPNVQTLESGLRDYFKGNLKNLTPSRKDLYKMVQLSKKNLPEDTFTPRDLQISG